jgi:hypothetical protein
MDTFSLSELNRLAARLVEAGIDKDTAWLAAGRYLSGAPARSWGEAIADSVASGAFSAMDGAKAFHILDGWVIR